MRMRENLASYVASREDNETRAATYRVLALAFRPPSDVTRQIWNALTLVSLPKDLDGGAELDPEQLSFEYNRLFVGPARLPCPPYESVYRKGVTELGSGALNGPSTLDASRKYAEAGVALAPSFKDLPDHIAIELDFMSYLCSKELSSETSEDSQRSRKLQEEFLKLHLAPWIQEFSERILSSTNSPFYRTLALTLNEFMKDEREYFGFAKS